jgi:predicted RNA-binding Zn ribbon-like protein
MGTTEPGGRSPAPAGLRAVQRFVNTNDREGRHEAWATPQGLADWLVDEHRVRRPPRLTGGDLARAVAIREGLREAAWSNNRGRSDAATIERFQRALSHYLLELRPSAGQLVLTFPRSDRPLDRALTGVLQGVLRAQANGTWRRLKACRRDICRWVFFDHSKNGSGTWCTMSICGNREKAQRFRDGGRRRNYPSEDSRIRHG